MPLAGLEGAPTEGDPVVEHHVIAELCGFPDDHAHAVVDHGAPPQLRRRMNLNPGHGTGEVREGAGTGAVLTAPQSMGCPVRPDRVPPRGEQCRAERIGSGRVSSALRGDVVSTCARPAVPRPR